MLAQDSLFDNRHLLVSRHLEFDEIMVLGGTGNPHSQHGKTCWFNHGFVLQRSRNVAGNTCQVNGATVDLRMLPPLRGIRSMAYAFKSPVESLETTL